MKAISLIQPWAQLWALGIKLCETRSWPTQFRGEIYIHASKSDSREGEALWNDPLIREYVAIKQCGVSTWEFEDLPRGVIVGKVNITNCVLMTPTVVAPVEHIECMCGEWKVGRFAFVGEGHELFKEPIPAKGQLGIWEYDPDQIIRERVEKEEQQQAKRFAATIRRRIKRERKELEKKSILSSDLTDELRVYERMLNQNRNLFPSYSDIVYDGRNGSEQKYSQQPVRPPAPDFDPTKPVKRKLRLE
jgi:hypothetical protein